MKLIFSIALLLPYWNSKSITKRGKVQFSGALKCTKGQFTLNTEAP